MTEQRDTAELEAAILSEDWQRALAVRERLLEKSAAARESFASLRSRFGDLDARIDAGLDAAGAFARLLEPTGVTHRAGRQHDEDPKSRACAAWLLAELGYAVEVLAWERVRRVALELEGALRETPSYADAARSRVAELARVFDEARKEARARARPLAARALAYLDGDERASDAAEAIRTCVEGSRGLLPATLTQDLDHLRGRMLSAGTLRARLARVLQQFLRASAIGDWAVARESEQAVERTVARMERIPTALARRVSLVRDRSARIRSSARTSGERAEASLRLLWDLGITSSIPSAAEQWIESRSWLFEADRCRGILDLRSRALSLEEARGRALELLTRLESRDIAQPHDEEGLVTLLRQTAAAARESTAMTEYRIRQAMRRRALEPQARNMPG